MHEWYRGCTRMVPNHRRLYSLLCVPPNASEADLKKSYRRLALQYHPDRNPEYKERFQEINRAYEILVDPKLRRTYDKYGEAGLEVLGAVKSSALAEVILNTRRARILFLMFCAIILGMLLQPIIIALRISGKFADWSWWIILLPNWIFNVTLVSLITFVFYLSWDATASDDSLDELENDGSIGSKAKDPHLVRREKRAAFVVVMAVVWVLFALVMWQEATIVAKVSGDLSWPWWTISLPYLVVEGLAFLWTTGSLVVLRRDPEFAEIITNYWIFKQLRWPLMRLLTAVMTIAVLSGASISWYLALSPVLIVPIASLILDYLHDRTRGDEEGKRPWATYMPFAATTLLTTWFVVALQVRLQGNADIGWFVVFIPVYIAFGILSLLFSGFAPFLYLAIPEVGDLGRGHIAALLEQSGFPFGPTLFKLSAP